MSVCIFHTLFMYHCVYYDLCIKTMLMFLLDTTTTMYTVGDVVALSKHLIFFTYFHGIYSIFWCYLYIFVFIICFINVVCLSTVGRVQGIKIPTSFVHCGYNPSEWEHPLILLEESKSQLMENANLLICHSS